MTSALIEFTLFLSNSVQRDPRFKERHTSSTPQLVCKYTGPRKQLDTKATLKNEWMLLYYKIKNAQTLFVHKTFNKKRFVGFAVHTE